MLKFRKNKRYYFFAFLIISLFLLNWGIRDHQGVEEYYSRLFYPLFSQLPQFFVGWIPWSIGDFVYASLSILLLSSIYLIFHALFKLRWNLAFHRLLKFITYILSIYLYFNVSWGINYYRTPITKQMNLDVDTVILTDHLTILNQHIQKLNTLRESIQFHNYPLDSINQEVSMLMKADQEFPMLSKTQVQIKSPINNTLASYFGVSGYFNPFTHEAHVNLQMPKASYPFTVAHELSHQMGIGFEDECNFIAFVKLYKQENPLLAYTAYYESVNYLMRSLYLVDRNEYDKLKALLSEKVIADLKAEQLYWKDYSGWINSLSSLFYNQYLKHNNQAEGMARYGLVSRLIIAYELRNNNQSGD